MRGMLFLVPYGLVSNLIVLNLWVTLEGSEGSKLTWRGVRDLEDEFKPFDCRPPKCMLRGLRWDLGLFLGFKNMDIGVCYLVGPGG